MKTTVNKENKKKKTTFNDVWGDIDSFESGFDSVKINVAVVLCNLLDDAGISRGQLAEKLDWKPSRITRVLSGDENPTLETLYKVCNASGYTFDVVVRKPREAQSLQPWQRHELMADKDVCI